MEAIKITNCSLGCMYAEGLLSKCQCTCGGATHGILAAKKAPMFAKCSPAVEVRCKSGQEGGHCECACGGMNHGLYSHIEHFDEVKITGLAYA